MNVLPISVRSLLAIEMVKYGTLILQVKRSDVT